MRPKQISSCSIANRGQSQQRFGLQKPDHEISNTKLAYFFRRLTFISSKTSGTDYSIWCLLGRDYSVGLDYSI